MNYIKSNTKNMLGVLKSYCKIVAGRVTLNGEIYFSSDSDAGLSPKINQDLSLKDNLRQAHDFFSAVYERLGVDYRKFYKMDALSKLGFLASEILLKDIDKESPKEDMGIVLFNRSSSLETDSRYQGTIRNKDDFFPSPAEFVYTLPNIVTGEIAIRNKITGETAFYVVPDFSGDRLCEAIENMINFAGMKYVLAGWTEVDAFTGEISGLMVLCEAQSEAGSKAISLTCDLLEDLYSKF